MAKNSLQFQWPCPVSKLELIFLCRLKGIERFHGKEVTAVLVILFNVQSEADIPLLPGKNGNILWQRSHWISVTLFSVQSEADIPLTPQGYGNTFQTLVLWNTTVLCIRRAFKIKKRDILYVLGINLFFNQKWLENTVNTWSKHFTTGHPDIQTMNKKKS